MLLSFSDYDKHIFHSFYFKETEDSKPCEHQHYAHLSMTKDSYLIQSEANHIDLRYFPCNKDIVFYHEQTGEYPLYVENVGHSTLYINMSIGVIVLEPKERKLVCEENVDKTQKKLRFGNTYPFNAI